ncbi:triose-phosphate isomerase [Coxiella endosymbiont of Amblyomma nuttalli]|uniref:triose-phosphate isomerase n=1 Tax=Coxiella endosymbiont of Amblyomma nuttalli TaxID=2749996 RepID=UPI001BA7A809|nr:triose-phosphate isomerase [Coxiella endosymbiont of Amblyomma nuttalli]QTS83665.1 Triosephosphate isomerase [Coxiella endosymbiont of Amblyomma nuttalli]
MKRRPLVAGNWKMHGTRESITVLLEALKHGCKCLKIVEFAVFPSFIFIAHCEAALMYTQISWGAQDVSEHETGAHTGEISAAMLRDFHCCYVIVGHSERRQFNGETGEKVAAKVKVALKHGIRPIICIGETENERETGQTLKVIQKQLAVVLSINDNGLLDSLNGMVIAYEPVWAIGTGKNATPDQVQEVHAAIRTELHAREITLAATTRIVYGGSVKPNNAGALFAMPDVDGVLVGEASLQAEQFLQIGQQCNRQFY